MGYLNNYLCIVFGIWWFGNITFAGNVLQCKNTGDCDATFCRWLLLTLCSNGCSQSWLGIHQDWHNYCLFYFSVLVDLKLNNNSGWCLRLSLFLLGVMSATGNGYVLYMTFRRKTKLRPPELMTLNLAIFDFGISGMGSNVQITFQYIEQGLCL